MPMFKPVCVLLLMALVSACSPGGTPSGTPFSPSAIATGQTVPAAALAVSTFTVTRQAVQRDSDWTVYDVKLLLAETSGKSGAVLQAIGLSVPVVGTDFGCTQSQRIRIGPGETWDMGTLGYCAPEVAIHKSVGTEVSGVSLSVTFADDAGRIGSLSGFVVTK